MNRAVIIVKKILMITALSASAIMPAMENFAQNRPFIDWERIRTGRFSIIYPSAVAKDARHLADLLEYLHPHLDRTLGAGNVKSDLILFTEYAESNGFSGLMPRRMVFFNSPPQNGFGGTTSWYTLLAVHEYRHMLQFLSLKRGTARALYYILGEQGLALAAFGTVPIWFFEGDAVVTETLFTKSGRGRTPIFDAEFRAQLLSGRKFDYYQCVNGTYRDHNPLESPYLMGYYLAAKIRRVYGGEIFMKINRRSMWLPVVPYRYTHSVDAMTGKYSSDWYRVMLDDLKGQWSKALEGFQETKISYLENENRKDWTASLAPQYAGDGSLVVYRRGMEESYRIVKIGPKGEGLIATTGRLEWPPSVQGNTVVWSEFLPDPRWTWRSFSDIYRADIAGGGAKRLTRGRRYYAPSLSPDGKKIAAVEFNEKNESSLVVLDSESGSPISHITAPGEAFLTPRWSRSGNRIVFSKVKQSASGGLAVFSCNGSGGDVVQHLPYEHENVMSPMLDDTNLYYVSSYSGIDGVYAMDLKTGEKFQVVARKFGAYYPSLSNDGSRIVFSDVTARGHVAASAPVDRASWTPIGLVKSRSIEYYRPLEEQEDAVVLDDIPHNDYASNSYFPSLHLVNVHSWTPWADTLNNDLSIYFLSSDIMDTTQIMAGYVFNWNEQTHTGIVMAQYSGWYPVIGIFGQYGTRASTYRDEWGNYKWYNWSESTGGVRLGLPLDFSRRGWERRIDLSAKISYTYISSMEEHEKNKNGNGDFIPAAYTLSISNTYGWIRDINPRWGQVLRAGYAHTPIKGDYRGELAFAELTLFFPSVFRHHSLFFQGSYEKQEKSGYHFPSETLFPRGYRYDFFGTFVKGSVNYTLPLGYPDMNAYVFYMKQVYFNAFFDCGVGLDGGRTYYRSVGGELVFEGMPLGYPIPIFIGLRYAFCIDQTPGLYQHTVGVVFGLAL